MFCYASSLLIWACFHPSFMSFLCRAQTTMSCYVTNFESLLLKEFPSNDMTKPVKAIIVVVIFSSIFLYREKGCILLHPFEIFIRKEVVWRKERAESIVK